MQCETVTFRSILSVRVTAEEATSLTSPTQEHDDEGNPVASPVACTMMRELLCFPHQSPSFDSVQEQLAQLLHSIDTLNLNFVSESRRRASSAEIWETASNRGVVFPPYFGSQSGAVEEDVKEKISALLATDFERDSRFGQMLSAASELHEGVSVIAEYLRKLNVRCNGIVTGTEKQDATKDEPSNHVVQKWGSILTVAFQHLLYALATYGSSATLHKIKLDGIRERGKTVSEHLLRTLDGEGGEGGEVTSVEGDGTMSTLSFRSDESGEDTSPPSMTVDELLVEMDALL